MRGFLLQEWGQPGNTFTTPAVIRAYKNPTVGAAPFCPFFSSIQMVVRPSKEAARLKLTLCSCGVLIFIAEVRCSRPFMAGILLVTPSKISVSSFRFHSKHVAHMAALGNKVGLKTQAKSYVKGGGGITRKRIGHHCCNTLSITLEEVEL
jgi:hypothetical protein